MTNDELDNMVNRGYKFWIAFSALCNHYIDAAPEHLKDEYTMYFGDLTSIYGRKSPRSHIKRRKTRGGSVVPR